MSRKPSRPRYKGSQRHIDVWGSDLIDRKIRISRVIRVLGQMIDKDCERPEVKPDARYRIEVSFDEIETERGRA